MASYDGGDLIVGHAKIVSYDDGREALVESVPDEIQSSINWYVTSPAGDYEVIVLGENLTPDQSAEIGAGF